MRNLISVILLILLPSLISCTKIRNVGQAPAPTLEDLKNATYSGLQFGFKEVTLVNGVWEGDPSVAGGASRPRVVLVEDLIVTADFDTNGSVEAVVFLNESTGGTGKFVYMAVVERKDGGLLNRGTVLIGDRVQIRNVRTEGWGIFLDLVEIGPDDAGCCPGQLTKKRWDVLPRGLFKTTVEDIGRLKPEAMERTEWMLERWGFREPAPSEPAITMKYEDGKFSGNGGCNSYFASVMEGDVPGEIAVGEVGSTEMACDGTVMATESRFLKGLAGVTKFGFHSGRLALTTLEDGTQTVYLFSRRSAE